jgi:hypothetical protein
LKELREIYVDANPVVAIIEPITDKVRGSVYSGKIVRNRKLDIVRLGPKCFGRSADVAVGSE